jgi:PPP family 3-phenylpropionic acid transporter
MFMHEGLRPLRASLPDPLNASRSGLSRAELSALSASTMLWVGVALPFFSVWLAARGLDAVAISAVLAVQQCARPLGNPLITWLADKTQSIGLTLFYVCLSVVFLYVLIAVADVFWLLLLGAAVAAFVQAPVGALVDALTLSEMRRRHNIGAPVFDYGSVRSWGSFVVLLGMLLGGVIGRYIQESAIIWLIIGCLVVPVFVAAAIMRHKAAHEVTSPSLRNFAPLKHKKMIVAVMCAAAFIQASHAVLYAFGSLQWRAMGFSAGQIGTFWAWGVACEIALFLIASRSFLSLRHAQWFLLIGGAGAVVRWMLFPFADGQFSFLGLMTLHALSFAATHLGAVSLMSEYVGPLRRAQAQGWLQGAISITTALATLGAGLFYDAGGAYIYWGMAAVAAAGMIGAYLVVRAPPHNDD